MHNVLLALLTFAESTTKHYIDWWNKDRCSMIQASKKLLFDEYLAYNHSELCTRGAVCNILYMGKDQNLFLFT